MQLGCIKFIFATWLQLQMYTKIFYLRLFLWFTAITIAGVKVGAQECTWHLHGQLLDEHDGEPLVLANIYVENTGQGTYSDEQGHFILTGMCAGPHTLIISHLQCQTQKIVLTLSGDTTVTWYLEHHEHALSAVTISGIRIGQEQSHTSHVITGHSLDKLAGKSLGEMLTTVSGVTAIRTGPGIVKPMVHGLYGQRIQTIINGLVQEGQQWGVEHAPEVDPAMAGSISVIKGAAAIKYGGSASAAAIIIDPEPLPTDVHTHGQVQLTGMSNNRLMQLSSLLEGGFSAANRWRWRVMVTSKLSGDSHAPNYNLSNTGQRELNVGWSAGYNGIKDALHVDFLSYNAQYGILRGAHIGNLSDLYAAINRKEPFFTRPFTYAIQNPQQRVHHQMIKGKYSLAWQDRHTLKILYGFQLNQRQEFDVRRGDRDKKPALDLNLLSHQLDVSNTWQVTEHFNHEGGVFFSFINNRNVPGTGVSPLIPNYRTIRPAIYQIVRWSRPTLEWDGGLRYEYQWLQAKYFEQNTLKTPIHNFHNFALSTGVLLWPKDRLNLRFNLGWNGRNPQVNELYSQGLHHSSALIEEGDQNLTPESSFKLTQTLTYEPKKEWHLELTNYWHYLEDFIYLRPLPEPRLTVRGAFPVYAYTQNNTRLWGLDFSSHLGLADWMHWDSKFYLVRGQNLEENKPLALMPADRWMNTLEFILPTRRINRSKELSFSGYQVWQQKRYPENEDFAPAPAGYFLMDVQFATDWQWGVYALKIQIGIQNIFNTAYRDYLNRLRYYADDTGRNLELRIKFIF